jgi:hypothetical protein
VRKLENHTNPVRVLVRVLGWGGGRAHPLASCRLPRRSIAPARHLPSQLACYSAGADGV